MIERLKKLQSDKSRYPNGRVLAQSLSSNQSLKSEIKALGKHFLKREIKGCSNCMTDAYFELIKLSIETIMNKKECQFEIRRGVLLHDTVNYDVSKCMTQNNITDELALYHLKTNPLCVKYFSKLPDNWEQLVDDYQLDGTIPDAGIEFTEEEQAMIKDFAKRMEDGENKTFIRNSLKDIKTVGEKKLTPKLITELLKQAENMNVLKVPPVDAE